MASHTLTYKIGFWAAILATASLAAFAIGFTVTIIAFPSAVEWHGIEAYATSYDETLMFFLMFPTFSAGPFISGVDDLYSPHYPRGEENTQLFIRGIVRHPPV